MVYDLGNRLVLVPIISLIVRPHPMRQAVSCHRRERKGHGRNSRKPKQTLDFRSSADSCNTLSFAFRKSTATRFREVRLRNPEKTKHFLRQRKGTKIAPQIVALFPQTAPSPAEWPGCRDCWHPRINSRKRAQPGQSHPNPTFSQTQRYRRVCSFDDDALFVSTRRRSVSLGAQGQPPGDRNEFVTGANRGGLEAPAEDLPNRRNKRGAPG